MEESRAESKGFRPLERGGGREAISGDLVEAPV